MKSLQRQYDVVIVGGGAAGLFAAYLMARTGLRVAVIEKNSENKIGEKVCGDAIGKHHFDALGIPHPELGFDAEGLFRGIKVVSPDESHEITVYGDGYALNRKMFGLRLYRMATLAGAEVYAGYRFQKPVIEGSWLRGIRALRPDGISEEFRAKVIVDASGVAAVVRRSLPSGWWVSESIPSEDFNVTYREIWSGDIDIDHDFAWIFLNTSIAPGGYWWLFPKRKGVYNVGLGVQWKKGNPNPRIQFEYHIKSRYRESISEVIDRGGGLVPTRRPIPCMVWNSFIVIGDAAATANPVHGGGIGPAMLSASIATKTVVGAFDCGDFSLNTLWRYHREYHQVYGAKQASLDVLRMFLQTMTNEGLNFVFQTRLVDGRELYNIGAQGVLQQSILSKVDSLLRLITKPGLLAKLLKLKQFMDRARELYLHYPDTPDRYEAWRSEERRFFDNYREWLVKSV